MPLTLIGQGGFSVVSWNIQDFGKTKDDSEILIIAKTVRDYDIVAIQEVVAGYGGSQAVAKLADELNRMGSKWDYIISDPTKSPPYKTERYAFLWKTAKVKKVGRGWLDEEINQMVFREPFLVKFKVKDKTFIVANYHSRRFDENPEEETVAYYNYPSRFKEYPIIIAGDFNIKSSHKVFAPLYENGFAVNLQKEKTTLKRKCDKKGNYRNHPIDFILYQQAYLKQTSAGVIDFIGSCEMLAQSRGVSDHLPVWVEFEFVEE
jgi:endonuclease/exonuclease/phosphatase family metal-dependent hydrolase